MKDIESIRNQNIERNKNLLKRLNIKNLNSSISNDLAATTKTKTKAKPNKSPRLSRDSTPSVPTRRSRRLAITEEDDDERKRRQEEEEKELQRQQNLRDSRSSMIKGTFGWSDLRADLKSGYLLNESYIYETSQHPDEKVDGIDSQQYEPSVRSQSSPPEVSTLKSSSAIAEVRNEFKQKTLFTVKDTDSFKLTPNRITSLSFHPDRCDRIISAGDTSGCLAIWAVDSENHDAQLNTVLLKPHGRTISRIVDIPHSPSRFLTASYDGSCRNFDLNKQITSECISIEDSEGFKLGVSDMSMVSENLMYITTLEGQLLSHDIREPPSKLDYKKFMRLHDKKIGGFAPNPSADYEIATASLDRTLKLWDLRKLSTSSISSIDDELSSPSVTKAYKSRLSISTVDWNGNNSLICNGYDDTIRIFDLKTKQNKTQSVISNKDLRPNREIKHNCQTGRWVSILKARWQRHPQDGFEKFAIANMDRSIDIFADDGEKISTLTAETMSAVPAVVAFHPTMNWVVGGSSSGKVYLFM